MIIITGAFGFIGSVLVNAFNKTGTEDLILVDDFSKLEKTQNLENKKYHSKIERSEFIDWFANTDSPIDLVVHIGARTDTTEFNIEIFNKLNLNYTKSIWQICSDKQIPLVYASSAATYGDGSLGYNDDHNIVNKLKPLNPYGQSKNDFDKWALAQKIAPPSWYGLKFFNVYGPNEYHKGRMASVVMHAFHQIQNTGGMKLFRSHRHDFKDGEQLRDFVYVKDVASVILWLSSNKPNSGLYNLGTGKARTFLDLARNTFSSTGAKENIDFIDTPLDIRDKYQYFTEANISKLFEAGYTQNFYSLEEGIFDYVKNYLIPQKYI